MTRHRPEVIIKHSHGMNRSTLPSSAFIDPRGKNRADIERVIQQVISLLLPYLTEATRRSPLPSSSIQEVLIPETTVNGAISWCHPNCHE
jgi:hypothetical protein